jgi:peptidoglycan hydrolase-like protein with peptidoglycan-binding domain
MTNKTLLLSTIVALALAAPAQSAADELTLKVEKGLSALGYDTGPVDGEETLDTTIAISKFQAENDLEVTGEVSPKLATTLAQLASTGDTGLSAATTPTAAAAAPPEEALPPAADSEALKAAQQACLEQKVAEAQETKKKKRGFGRLLGAVSRTVIRSGGNISGVVADAMVANQGVEDIGIIAEELGISEDDVAECKNL